MIAFMGLYLWIWRWLAAREVPDYHEIATDPIRLASAIDESRTNGSSTRLRAALSSEGSEYADNERLNNARGDAIRSDSSKYVRYAALRALMFGSARVISFSIYPRSARQAIESALRDKHPRIRMAAKMNLREFDQTVKDRGLEHEQPETNRLLLTL